MRSFPIALLLRIWGKTCLIVHRNFQKLYIFIEIFDIMTTCKGDLITKTGLPIQLNAEFGNEMVRVSEVQYGVGMTRSGCIPGCNFHSCSHHADILPSLLFEFAGFLKLSRAIAVTVVVGVTVAVVSPIGHVFASSSNEDVIDEEEDENNVFEDPCINPPLPINDVLVEANNEWLRGEEPDPESLPTLSISARDDTIVEGDVDHLVFNIEVDIELECNFQMSYRVIDHGGFAFSYGHAPQTYDGYIIIVHDAFNIYITVPLWDNESKLMEEAYVEVVILPSIYYHIKTDPLGKIRYDTAKTLVIDDDPTNVSIAPTRKSVEEGEDAVFAITSDVILDTDRNLEFNVETKGNFIAGKLPNRIVLPRNKDVVFLRIKTVDDAEFEREGWVKVTLLKGEDAIPRASPYNGVKVAIRDNDNSLPAIFVVPSYEEVVEGNTVVFHFGAENIAPESDLTIKYRVTIFGDFFVQYSPTDFSNPIPIQEFKLEAGKFIGKLEIETENDREKEPDGGIIIEIIEGEGYVPLVDNESPNHIADVGVVNNDIEVDNEITEFPRFRIAVDPSLLHPYAEYIPVLEEGHEFYDKYETCMNPIQSDERFVVRTFEDGSCIIRTTRYQVQEGDLARFLVYSNILPSSTVNLKIRYQQERDFIVGANGDLDFEKIHAVEPSEWTKISDTGEYRIRLVIPTINNGRNLGDGNDGRFEFRFRGNVIDDGRQQYDHGEISLTLMQNSGYSIDDAHKSASVTFMENETEIDPEVPVVSLTVQDGNASGRIVEGDVAVFTIQTDVPVNRDIKVLLRVIQRGDFVLWRLPTSVTLKTGHQSVNFSIPTKVGTVASEQTGSFTVRLIRDVDFYTVSSTDNIAVVAVDRLSVDERTAQTKMEVASLALAQILANGNQVPESPQLGENAAGHDRNSVQVVSVEPVVDTVVEGENAVFEVTAMPPFAVETIVDVNVSESGGKTDYGLPVRVNFQPGQSTNFIEKETLDDRIAGGDRQISATIRSGSGYKLGNSASSRAIVTIRDRNEWDKLNQSISLVNRQIIPSFLNSATEYSMRTTGRRSAQVLSGLPTTDSIAGVVDTIPKLIMNGGEIANGGNRSWLELLSDTNFQTPLSFERVGNGTGTLWSRGSRNFLQGELNSLGISWSGHQANSVTGTDVRIGTNSTVGISTSIADMEAKVSLSNPNDLDYQFLSVAAFPYFGWMTTNRELELHLMSGIGKGEAVFKREGVPSEFADTTSFSTSVEGTGTLANFGNESAGNQGKINVRGQTQIANHFVNGILEDQSTVEIQSRNVRIWVEGLQHWRIPNVAKVNSGVSLGVLHQEDNEELLRRGEIGGRFGFKADNGLDMQISGQKLLQFGTYSGTSKYSAQIDFDMDRDREGLHFSVTSTIYSSQYENPYNLNALTVGDLDLTGDQSSKRWIGFDLKYGMREQDGNFLLTPVSNFKLGDGGNERIGVGCRLALEPDVKIGLEAVRKSVAGNLSENRLNFSGELKW